MTFPTGLAVASSFLIVLVACGGTVSAVSDGGAGGGGSSGGSGIDGGGGGSCTTATLAGDRACVPGIARANVALEIAVDAAEGCLGCFTTFDPCKVDVSGTTITVSMTTKTCPPPGDQACPAICALPGTTCKIPALAAGTYTIAVTGDGKRTGLPPRELVVTDDATETSCKLPQPPNLPEQLAGTKYSTSCSGNDDCVLATVGDVCAPCKCPNAAIAKSAQPAYRSDYRARTSQCRARNEEIACAACAPATAFCKIDPSALTGTCVVQ
ncbi:MAG: hypothetical protein JWP87_899 [Labilithrix sp.]|nr:hypothetical protein [Labilithrix sp.]